MGSYARNVWNSLAASSVALWRGTNSNPAAIQPAKPIELYEMENCPYCRLVREALTELNMDVMIYPCPKQGTRFRPKVIELGGKAQFPFMVDPNTGVNMYESADIIAYLYENYGKRKAPSHLQIKTLNTATSYLATGVRGFHGYKVKPSTAPEKPLELWSFESSPFARPVRELLCEMELPYLVHNIGKGQWQDFVLTKHRQQMWPDMQHKNDNRQALKERTGKVMSPYFADPNTGEEFYESLKMLKYLQKTYSA